MVAVSSASCSETACVEQVLGMMLYADFQAHKIFWAQRGPQRTATEAGSRGCEVNANIVQSTDRR